MENEPAWLTSVGRGGWRQYGYLLAQWRAKAGVLGKLENRLLALVLTELERDLSSLQASSRSMYAIGSSWFWNAKRDRFLAVARKVIELKGDSPAHVVYAARYLWDGLHARELAVSTLLDAEARGKLTEAGRLLAVQWLFDLGRYGDALPLLEKLHAARPDRLAYRTRLIRALHETGDDPAARKLLAETDSRFHELERWDERALAAVARVCRACGFQAAAVRYYEDLIPLFQRTHRNRGIGSGTLSAYYSEVSSCYAALGKTDQAVDAASAAIVAWGRNRSQRCKAPAALQKVLENIPELDTYVARRDAQVKRSGLDAPVLRKTLGRIYLLRNKPGQAIVQLLAARDLQPTDEETYDLLLQAYDRKQDPAGACGVLLESIGLSPRNVKLYTELGRRYEKAKQPAEAERAWTGLVEALPNEARSHQLLAEHWQVEKRYDAALVQWRQVIRVRTKEPAGWMGLARTQIAAGKKAAAKKTLEELLGGTWEPRFRKVREQAAALLASLGGRGSLPAR